MLNNVVGVLGAGTPPVTNSYESIATYTASGGETSFTFSSIPATYKHLQIRALVGCSSTTSVSMRFNGDSTGGNYAWHRLVGDGTNASSAGGGGSYRIFDLTGNSTYFMGGVVDILDYSNTNKNTTSRSLHGVDSNGAFTGEICMISHAWFNTAAVSSVLLSADAGSFSANTQFALYGIKG